MKSFLMLCFICFSLSLLGQFSNYAGAMAEGDRLLGQGAYKSALRAYFAAEAFDPSRRDEVGAKLETLFDAIEKERDEAQAATAKAEAAMQKAEKAKIRAELAKEKAAAAAREASRSEQRSRQALAQTQKIVGALYFYDGKYTLTSGRDEQSMIKFGFMNKKGDVLIGYRFDRAEPFRKDGFARVYIKGKKYLLDTTGRQYLLAERLEDLTAETEALDLRYQQLQALPQVIGAYSKLKVLLLSNNALEELPPSLAKLQALRHLDLGRNKLSKLPASVTELRALTYLSLNHNALSELPSSIGALKALKVLKADFNALAEFPSSIGELQKLKVLNVEFNEVEKLMPSLGRLRSLKALYLMGNFPAQSEIDALKKALPDCMISVL